MKKLWILSILAVVVLSPTVWAASVATVDGYGPWQTGVGGEFTLQVLSSSSYDGSSLSLSAYSSVAMNRWTATGTTPNFQTFCVEGSEYIYPTPATYDTTQGQVTQYGGGSPTTLTVGAAYLYFKFAKGQLTTYDYSNTGVGRHTSAGQLQNAIWYYMGQENQTYDSTNPYETLVTSTLGSSLAFSANSSLGVNAISVSVLSLWGYTTGQTGTQVYTLGGARQDQLILTGNQGFSVVPEGGTTIAMLGLAMSALFAVGRRMRK